MNFVDFVRRHVEPDQLRRPEGGRNSNVCGIAAAGDHDSSDTRMGVASVESKPTTIEEYFVPSAEVHRRGISGNADVAEIAGAIPRRDIHAPGKRDCQVGEVAAYATALVMPLRSGPVAARMMVTELDAIVGVVTDRLGA